MIANYHTHTRWCHHGTGEIAEYIEAAVANGFEELAITEHVPLLGDPDPRRLMCAELPAFDAELNRLIRAYAGKIRILKGFECEYYPEQLGHYRRLLRNYGYHFLFLGQHTNRDRSIDNFALTEPWQAKVYADDVCEALETGLFRFVAHPDVICCGVPALDGAREAAMRRIFAVCESLSIPVEINANGWHYRRGYPSAAVWTNVAPKFRLQCIVGADAHTVADLTHPSVAACEDMARKAGLRLLEKLSVEG